MKCPVCSDKDLLMTERQGVEIDYCPSCRGVWLDRGELDKIIERSNEMAAPAAPQKASRDESRDDHHDSPRDDQGYSGHDSGSKKKKKKKKSSLFGDILGGLGGD